MPVPKPPLLPCLELLQPLRDPPIPVDLQPQGKGVDEEAYHSLDTCKVGRPACNGETEKDLVSPEVAAQENRPGALDQRVHGQVMARGEGFKGGAERLRQPGAQTAERRFLAGKRSGRGKVEWRRGGEAL